MYGFLFIIYFTWVFSTITRPTKVSSNNKTLIDKVWINNIGAVKMSGVILSGISGLYLIFLNHYLTNEKLDTRETYNVQIWNRACYDKICALLCEINWNGICKQMFHLFNVTLVSIYK